MRNPHLSELDLIGEMVLPVVLEELEWKGAIERLEDRHYMR